MERSVEQLVDLVIEHGRPFLFTLVSEGDVEQGPYATSTVGWRWGKAIVWQAPWGRCSLQLGPRDYYGTLLPDWFRLPDIEQHPQKRTFAVHEQFGVIRR